MTGIGTGIGSETEVETGIETETVIEIESETEIPTDILNEIHLRQSMILAQPPPIVSQLTRICLDEAGAKEDSPIISETTSKICSETYL